MSVQAGQLHARAERALFGYARLHAQDLVAEVMADLARHGDAALPVQQHAAACFVEGVIRNRALHVNRREARLVPLSDVLARETPDTRARAGRADAACDVTAALRRLTPRERQLAAMHWLDEWTSAEMADALGISIRTVKELLRRAKRRLRADLASYQCHRLTDGTPERTVPRVL